MDRPDHIPAPGERRPFDPWCFGFSEDEYDDPYSDDYFGDYYGDELF